MKNVLIYGHKSFIAKNFVKKFYTKCNFFIFKKKFNNDNKKKFIINLLKFINQNKIKFIINFAANNNNSIYAKNFKEIYNINFYLPLALLEVCHKEKVSLVLFLSKDIYKSKGINSIYSISKIMLKSCIENINYSNRLKIFDIESIFGPDDLNFRRIIPAMCLKILSPNHKKLKINLKKKKLIYVDKIINKIFLSFETKSINKFITIKSKIYNIKSIYNYLIKKNLSKTVSIKKYKFFEKTFFWYKKYLTKIDKKNYII